MRSKAPLALMEQTVMVLVFALAAALCLRVFVWSDHTSDWAVNRDVAVIEAQNAAEIIKREGTKGGDAKTVFDGAADKLGGVYREDTNTVEVYYDSDWNTMEAANSAKYTLSAHRVSAGVRGLETAHVQLSERGGDMLFETDVAWQTEVAE